MKILFITAEGFDTPNPNNQMAETMIGEFLNNGYQVHLIQSHRKGVNSDIPDSLINREKFVCDTVTRKVVDKSNFVKRYFNDFKYAFSAMKYWRKVKDADVVYLQSNPTIIYPMLLLRLFYRKPIVYSIYDIFPGHAYDIGVIRSKFIFNALKLLQKPCYKIADVITVLSEDMREELINIGVKSDKIKVVPAWYDIKNTHEIARRDNLFIKKYNIPENKFYVQFAGSLGYIFNYKTVLALAKEIKEKTDIVIQIVGDGPIKETFIKEAEESGLKNIDFYPLQPVELVPHVYSACDLCVIPLKKSVIRNAVPSKAPILMACRRTIVNSVEINSKYASAFHKYNMGISVDIEDVRGLADAVIYLYENPEILKKMADNANEYGKTHYSSTKSIRLIMNIFDKWGKNN